MSKTKQAFWEDILEAEYQIEKDLLERKGMKNGE